ncbi:MAG: hypothetical protein SF069_08195 [Phycisphaerae bacterium]|nr:hypothetical protein [Phycisphaerae bacterium]
MCRLDIAVALCGLLMTTAAAAQTPATGSRPAASQPVEPSPSSAPAISPDLNPLLDRAAKTVEQFFGDPIAQPYETRVFANRAEMSAFAAAKWKVAELPCWAVAMGTGSTFALLAPQSWAKEACGHDAADTVATERLITHELVHVYHGQHRADAEFNEADEVGWFVEGLAVLASGQLDDQRIRQAADAIRGDAGPKKLVDGWSGNARYGLAGTMVRLVDQRLGRAKLKTLLAASDNATILAALGMTEQEFLAAWRQSLAQPAVAP